MTIKRFDQIEELRPLPADAMNSEAIENHSVQAESPLAYDVYRVGNELHIDFDVPGVDPSAIRLSIENQFLTVSVERELPHMGVEMIERRRVHGSFERRLVLPGHWRLDALRASCENGVLQIRAPLVQGSVPRAILVEVPVRATSAHPHTETLSGGDEEEVGDRKRVGSAA